MRIRIGMRQVGGALALAVALSLAGVTVWAEQKPAKKAEKAEKKAAPEEAVPEWVGWLNDRLPFGLNVTGVDIEAGGRVVGGDTDAAKFQEYRVLDTNPFLDHARITLETKDKKRYVEFSTFDAGRNDQSYEFRAGKYGGYELEIFWDQIPHLLSTTGRTLFNTTLTDSTADLTLPPSRSRNRVSERCQISPLPGRWAASTSRRSQTTRAPLTPPPRRLAGQPSLVARCARGDRRPPARAAAPARDA